MNPTWHTILTGLTGLRLAVYDDLLRDGRLQYDTLTREIPAGDPAAALASLQATFAWLERYRLLRRGQAEGDWRAVPIAQAAQLYEAHGPIEPNYTVAAGLPAQEGRGDRRSQGQGAHAERGDGVFPPARQPVHTHQTVMFEL